MTSNSQTELRILEAASEVFLRKGKDGARMKEIARKAGINQALLHYYFRTKDRLYEKVLRREFSRFLDSFLSAVEEESEIQTFLHNFIDRYIDALAERPEVVQFVLWEIRQGGRVFRSVLRRRFGGKEIINYPFVRLILLAQEKGEIRKVDPVQLVISLLGMCLYPFIARPILEKLLLDEGGGFEQFVQARKEAIFDLVWNGLRPGAEKP